MTKEKIEDMLKVMAETTQKLAEQKAVVKRIEKNIHSLKAEKRRVIWARYGY